MKIYRFLVWSMLAMFLACSPDTNDDVGNNDNPDTPGQSEPDPEPQPEPEPEPDPIEPFELSDLDSNLPSFVSVDDTTPETMEWVKVDQMSDEFDGDEIDRSKWFNSFWHYAVPVFMSGSSQNSGVADGKMWIKATLNERNPEGRWFQSARIHSKMQITYPMYTECSMKAANIAAFNTFWMNNGDINNRDEIDIVENNSNPTQECRDTAQTEPGFLWDTHLYPTQMNSQYFIAKDGQTENRHGNFSTNSLSNANPNKGKTWDEDYHIVGAWWKDARNVQFYLNGEEAGQVTTSQDMNRPLELLFDLWSNEMCNISGLPEREDLNDDSINTMRVDWVRTWKLEAK